LKSYIQTIYSIGAFLLVCAITWLGSYLGHNIYLNSQWVYIGPIETEIKAIDIVQPNLLTDEFVVLAQASNGRLFSLFVDRSEFTPAEANWVDISNSRSWDSFPQLTLKWHNEDRKYHIYVVDQGKLYLIDDDGSWIDTTYTIPNDTLLIRTLGYECCTGWLIVAKNKILFASEDFDPIDEIFSGREIKLVISTQSGLTVTDADGEANIELPGQLAEVIRIESDGQVYPLLVESGYFEREVSGSMRIAIIGHGESPTGYIFDPIESNGIRLKILYGGLGGGISSALRQLGAITAGGLAGLIISITGLYYFKKTRKTLMVR
jgi:hypothetical protein